MNGETQFPRSLTTLERGLLEWLLPADRRGYRAYRELLDVWKVSGQGRRGEGNYILAAEGTAPDNESPLPQVLAYGLVETEGDEIAVLVRERLGDQVEFEIASLKSETIPREWKEIRRWTYSTWLPGKPCPICRGIVREVPLRASPTHLLALAICRADKKIWIYDSETGINHIIPLTNFYNELMLHKNVREPSIALRPELLFANIDTYSDRDLLYAFVTYNKLRTKIVLDHEIVIPPEPRKSLLQRLRSLFKRG